MTVISMKRLATVAGVAGAVAGVKNITAREALTCLAEWADNGALPLRLFHVGGAADEGPVAIEGKEVARIWEGLRQNARRRRFDRNPIPPAASTWMLHVDDLKELVESQNISAELFDELGKLRPGGEGLKPNSATASPPRRLLASAAQDSAILAKLAEHGYSPLKMPKAPSGNKPWPLRVSISAELGFSPEVMRKAWQRLRTEKQIVDA